MTTKPLALISVADRTNLIEFAQGLIALNFELLCTTGSGAALAAAGIPFTAVEAYTKSPEILDGRVKTLHPAIHAGLLAKLDSPSHCNELAAQNLRPITVCAVNLYPFSQALRSGADLTLAKMTELVDIGGPTMIRAAAKNHKFVLPIIDPGDYQKVLEFLKVSSFNSGDSPAYDNASFRLNLAAKVFQAIAQYDLDIARFMSQIANAETVSSAVATGAFEGFAATRAQALRYGENPHQRAAFYRDTDSQKISEQGAWQQLGGKELSYNNLLDIDASLRVIAAISRSSSQASSSADSNSRRCAGVIIKHANPCGVAYGSSGLMALQLAKRSDPRSHFGGIIALDVEVSAELATEVRGDFAEVLVAPAFTPEAVAILSKSANLRLIQATPAILPAYEMRSCLDGILVQERDPVSESIGTALVGSMPADISDLELAWAVCSQTKSNAIVIAKGGYILATGAGQMSRIDSVELALQKARIHGHDVINAVAASDAFFPFPDGLEALIAAGVKTVIAPTGAKRDADVLAVARAAEINFIGAAQRHFRH